MNKDLLNSTIVPIDFSDTSMLALDHASAMAKIMHEDKQKVTLVHIIEGANFNSVTDSSQVESGSRDALAIEGAINRFEKIIEKYSSNSSVTYNYIVAGGKPYKKIAEIAEQTNADMIVMGTHGSSGIQAFAGSNASRVVQLAPCPVIVVREKPFGRGYKNIVLPLDLTKETKQKVNFAVKIARYYDATIHLISMHESDEFLEHKLRNNLTQVEQYLEEKSVKLTSSLVKASGSNFAKQTLSFAEEKNADLIIIMTQQEKDFAEYFFGSYAQQIVNRSPIPVMTINPRMDLEGILESLTGTGIYSH